ncbi:MAG: hypothetical protein K2Q14_01785 [Gammaproteobacteria bacterium]|nr:hypothetical protein [Gammaproteobacteria bacterium]
MTEILSNKGVKDPKTFIDTARKNKIYELLYNPLVLKLLADAVNEKQSWPKNREEIYTMACVELVSEKNQCHSHSGQQKFEDILLSSAEYLCAIQLLAGIAGFALDKNRAKEQYIDFRKLSAPGSLDLSAALHTNIFVHDGEELHIPVHRSVAEFLGAKYLADLIKKDNPLPLERVLALMPDETGAIASDLRGLCAWLAVHCNGNERRTLIERDPIGVIFYGDVSHFTVEEKKLILNTFENKAKTSDWPNFDHSFGALGTTDMVPLFQEILTSPSRTDQEQKLNIIVLSAIAHGQPMPELKDTLEKMIRDSSYISAIRGYAVEALLNCGKTAPILLKIAEDIRNNIVEDRDDEVLGELLKKLYPEYIPPAEIFSYLHQGKNEGLFGAYFRFWTDTIIYSKSEALPILLDQLVQKKSEMTWIAVDFSTKRWIGKLLVKGLEIYGNKITEQRLYDWLSLGIHDFGTAWLESDEAKTIAAWFEAYPDKYKTVIEYGAFLNANKGDFDACMWGYCERLQHAKQPADMLNWYQEKIKLVFRKYPQIAKFYLKQAMLSLRDDQKELDLLKHEIKDYRILVEYFEQLINPFVKSKQEYLLQQQERNIKEQAEKHERAIHFREHLQAIRAGTAATSIMYNLAQAYKGEFYNIAGATPDERLKDLFNNDKELVDAAYCGLTSAIYRQDLPTEKEIIKLATQGKMHFICPACLISINELYKQDSMKVVNLKVDLLRQLLAFYFTDGSDKGREQKWVLTLIKEYPALVEQVLTNYLLAMIKAKKEFIPFLTHLHSEEYVHFAPKILPLLLEHFPLRVSHDISKNILNPLMRDAIQFLDEKMLESIIKNRLGNSSMDDAQKIYWLACGFIISPEKYRSKLQEHVEKNQTYTWYLSSFVQNSWVQNKLFSEENRQTIGFLIELLAPECSPERLLGTYTITSAMHTADFVYALIHKLQHNLDKDFTELERLLNISNISNWHPMLERALHVKQVTQCISSFRYLKTEEIAQTLENGKPANAGDLCALTMIYLRKISENILNNSTNDYLQYWSYKKKNKKLINQMPHNEEDCRDVLLSVLKADLNSYHIAAEREGNYADDKRADIKVLFNGFNIPVEIKKDSHKDIWDAIHTQLIPKYMRDPGTGGYGIYIVFWFGNQLNIIDPIDGVKIHNAKQLETHLRQRLTDEESRRIEILVIDCSLPDLNICK